MPRRRSELVCVQAPDEHQPCGLPALFLAGGISDAPDWQAEIRDLLADQALVVINPRLAPSKASDADNPAKARRQIEWEFRHFRKADAMLFWFPRETLCPIVLYELGAWSVFLDERGPRPLFVGVHPEYERRLDVEWQTHLARPEVPVVYSLADLAGQVRQWLASVRPGFAPRE